MQQMRVLTRTDAHRTNWLQFGDVRMFAVLVAWANLVAAVTDPRHRPIFKFATGPLAGTAGLAAWAVTGHLLVGLAALVVVLVGFLLFAFFVFMLDGVLARSADRVYLLRAGHGRACGKVTVHLDLAWELKSVAAWPFGQGCGRQVVQQVCDDADHLTVPVIRLTADTDKVARWYEGFGFVETGRSRLRLPQMERRHQPSLAAAQPRTASAR